MVAPSDRDALVIHRRYAASPEKLFDLWTRPEFLAQWMRPSVEYAHRCLELDVNVGGRYRIAFESPDGQECPSYVRGYGIGPQVEASAPCLLIDNPMTARDQVISPGEMNPMNEADEALVERIRPLMKRRRGYSEKKMFGGLCFFINGNMAVGPWKGSLIVRLAREEHDRNQQLPYATPMDITGKVMKGWVKVLPEGVETEDDLRIWVDRAVAFVRTLPPK
ncbi:MAG: TfoX/Sxy family protein [Planctomycetales bacterium]|nr:TfoX/Sxy family protein [Planctomycetales bacterium]